MTLESDDHQHDANDAGQAAVDQGADSGIDLPTTVVPPEPVILDPNSKPKDNASKWRANTKLGLEIFGVVLLFAYTWFSCLQWLQLRYTNKLTARALDGSDHALQLTLDKLQKQIDAATASNTNFLDSERAWLGATVVPENFQIGGKADSFIYFNNTGKRPAKILDSNIQSGCYKEFPNNPENEYAKQGVHGAFIATPGGGIYTAHRPLMGTEFNPANPAITEKMLSDLNSGVCPLYIFGKVEYSDVYGTDRWWTHVCVRYVPAKHPDEISGFANCREYNDAR